jgi:mannose-1-phosphate guanylyltransferase/mannose-1-phosphate guanylyltransferase/phosphomannomutase
VPTVTVRAYLMAAGLGTRLYPLTGLTSKPMVPILNRPVMEHLLHLLRRHGVTEIAANLHYHPDKIRTYFGDGSELGVDLRYNVEERLLGTAGGADAFREFLSGGTFLVMSGDGLTDADLTAFLAAHRASGGVASMAVKQVDDPSLYGVVVHDDDHRVTGFQ